MDDLLEQLKQHCLCMNASDEKLKRALERALALFSTWTCGNQIGIVKRRERIRVKRKCDCSCRDQYVEVYPFYPNPRNYVATIETIDGMTKTPPVPALFLEVEPGVVRVDTSQIPCVCECSCDETYVILEYDAFWDAIPDDLLPLFCDLMRAIEVITGLGCGDCATCKSKEAINIAQWYEEVQQKRVAPDLYAELNKFIFGYYDRIIRKYSLCKSIRVLGVKGRCKHER